MRIADEEFAMVVSTKFPNSTSLTPGASLISFSSVAPRPWLPITAKSIALSLSKYSFALLLISGPADFNPIKVIDPSIVSNMIDRKRPSDFLINLLVTFHIVVFIQYLLHLIFYRLYI